MSETTRMHLPLLAAAQAQKHVTHNEALLRLDALSHPVIVSQSLTLPPVNPSEGDLYLLPAGSTGDWLGHDDEIAEWRNGVWEFYLPFEGLSLAVSGQTSGLTRKDGTWLQTGALISEDRVLARSGFGAESRHQVIEAELAGLSGAVAETGPLIPDRAIVFCVSLRVADSVTGATSFDCGLDGEPSKFGGSLGTAPGASNLGVIGPTAFYAPTPVRVTANGGSFTGGSVRLAVHCFVPTAPDTA
ncbi:DUF2793 domain-containing protein [Roseibium denhamense]|uniref:Uncharacterized protein n=1 Tax=Roseibium denhamense TaxID=76305 RepID=A0ABY1PQ21_9HYPH|nr:DUF2793 domain-containing protein [Roseibium denhamense]MTI05719.1 DUF2793 domain-containing protein [Roseibium denhamense]SMP36944.1 Protein of unknown function [Roseibium denhamense]